MSISSRNQLVDILNTVEIRCREQLRATVEEMYRGYDTFLQDVLELARQEYMNYSTDLRNSEGQCNARGTSETTDENMIESRAYPSLRIHHDVPNAERMYFERENVSNHKNFIDPESNSSSFSKSERSRQNDPVDGHMNTDAFFKKAFGVECPSSKINIKKEMEFDQSVGVNIEKPKNLRFTEGSVSSTLAQPSLKPQFIMPSSNIAGQNLQSSKASRKDHIDMTLPPFQALTNCSSASGLPAGMKQDKKIDSRDSSFHTDLSSLSANPDLLVPSSQTLGENEASVTTQRQPYSCNVCGRKYLHKCNLTVHQRVHTGNRPYHCYICEKTFISSNILNNHVERHFKTGNRGPKSNEVATIDATYQFKSLKKPASKLFVCDICGKPYSLKVNLHLHRKSHMSQDEFPFKCLICGKIFKRANHLGNHQRVHSIEDRLQSNNVV